MTHRMRPNACVRAYVRVYLWQKKPCPSLNEAHTTIVVRGSRLILEKFATSSGGMIGPYARETFTPPCLPFYLSWSWPSGRHTRILDYDEKPRTWLERSRGDAAKKRAVLMHPELKLR